MISANAKFWIWVTLGLGYNTSKVKRLTELYSDISLFYLGGKREWRFCGILSDNDIEKLSKFSLDDAQKIIDRCRELGYSVIAVDDESYPMCLFNIDAPPAVIYVSGVLPDIDNRLSIGVVGTRRATDYGLKNSYKIAYALSKYGVTIVSGGALGVDCASHRGSLASDGVTICVRGCGINCSYLHENEQMRHAITKRGAVISEYPPDETPRNYYFPARNRIISALSDGVLVIEAGVKSGSLITANLALEQGKEVFALLGNNNPQNEGSNNRIKEGSAIPITDFMDILNAFDNLYATNGSVDFDNISLSDIEAIPVKGKSPFRNKSKTFKNISKREIVIENIVDNSDNEIKHKENLNLNATAQRVYEYISSEPVHIDKISSDLNIPVFKVLVSLTELEMKNLVTALQGRRYILK